jgi:hypothetical protein
MPFEALQAPDRDNEGLAPKVREGRLLSVVFHKSVAAVRNHHEPLGRESQQGSEAVALGITEGYQALGTGQKRP